MTAGIKFWLAKAVVDVGIFAAFCVVLVVWVGIAILRESIALKRRQQEKK